MKKIIFSFIIFLSFSILATAQWVKIFDLNNRIVEFAESGNILYAAISGREIYKTTNYGDNWSLVNTCPTNSELICFEVKDSLIFLGTDTGLFKSTNYGNNWNFINSLPYTVMSLTYANNFLFAGIANGIYRSPDYGITWELVNYGLPLYYPEAFSLAFPNGNLFAGVESILPTFYNRLYKSTNFGNSWFVSGPDTINHRFYNIYTNNDLIITGTEIGFFLSSNAGANWRFLNGATGTSGLYGISTSGNKNIFISSWVYGFFVSNDSGYNWVQRNEGLNSLRITTSYKFGNYLFLGTNPSGYNPAIFRRPVNELVYVKTISTEIPPDYKLFQNYPNPFNLTTIIKFCISGNKKWKTENGNISLKVFNVLGKEIATLINEKLQPGTYEVNFNGNNLSSGIYFYKIQSGDFVQVKRMVLIK
jgi:hypothetical protein